MTTTTVPPTSDIAARETATRTTPWSAVLASEWVKFTSLRATWVTLGVGLGLAVAISALLSMVVGATWDEWEAAERADFDPILFPLAGGIASGIALAVIGVKVVANEYSSGMMRLTLTVTPRRDRVLAAKLVVIAAVSCVFTFVSAVAMFGVGQVFFAAYDLETASFGDGDVLRMILGMTATGPLMPLLGAVLAFGFRSSAGAITGVLAAIFAPGIVGAFLPDWWQRNVLAYLPGNAADSIAIGHLQTDTTAYLDAPLAGAVVVAWTILLVAVAHVTFSRRDA